jgi:hypothetical protein
MRVYWARLECSPIARSGSKPCRAAAADQNRRAVDEEVRAVLGNQCHFEV